jgi:hypothetical protein
MPTSDPTQWRLDLAAEIAVRLRRFPDIRAMVVAGSVARGFADEYSDLELPLFWETLPSDETRQQIAADLGADFLYPYNGPAQEDNLSLHGFQVDFWHCTVSNEEQVIRRVLSDYSTDLSDSNFMDTVRACIPLTGETIIHVWKEQARAYPTQLALRNIQLQLDQIQASHLAVLARRDNPSLLYGEISGLQQRVFQILLALNSQYFPTFKWIYPVLANLPVKPLACVERFRQAYLTSPADAAIDTARIVTETLRLVQKTFPQLDIAPALDRLKLTRASHTKPVHL